MWKETTRNAKPASGLKKTSRTIGDGITSRTVNVIDTTRSSESAVVAALQKILTGPSLETFLKGYVREHGLPDDPGPGTYVALLPRKDERRTHLWYAAAILDEIRKERIAIRRRDPIGASKAGFRAGDLHREAALKFQWESEVQAHQRVREGASKGGEHKKRRLGIEQAIRDRLAKSPRLSARALFDQLMRYRNDDPLSVGPYLIHGITEGQSDVQKICERGPGGTTKHLHFRSFEGYVSRVKKDTST